MLFFVNLKTLITKMKMFFYLMFIVFFVTTISILYIFCFYKSSIVKNNNYLEKLRSYTIEYNQSDIDVKLESFTDSNKNDIQRIYVVISNNDDLAISNYYGESPAEFKVLFGKYIDNNSKQIIIPQEDGISNENIGDYYYIGDEGFLIVGINNLNQYEFPYNALENKNLIQGFVIVTKDNLHGQKQKAFIEDIQNVFQTENIEVPNTENNNSPFGIELFVIFCLVLLGIINITFIYLCLLKKRKKQQAVFYILGCRKINIYIMYIGEILFLTTVFYLICYLSSKFVLFNILNQINNYLYLFLEFKDYLILYIIYSILIIIILLRQTIMFFNKSPYEMKRG